MSHTAFIAGTAAIALVATLGGGAQASPMPQAGGCGPSGGATTCGAGGSDSGSNGTGRASGARRQSGETLDTCGYWFDQDQDGEDEYYHAQHVIPAGYTASDDYCYLTGPDGTSWAWSIALMGWIDHSRNETGAAPEWCAGYDPDGRWHWGIVAGTQEPQPIWGRLGGDGSGVCPTPGDPGQNAEFVVDAWMDRTLEPGDIALAPPEDDPNAMGVVGRPVWMWFENPTLETVGSEEPFTLTEGRITVQMQVMLDRVDFDMGDGNVVTCAYDPESGTVGTPYTEEMVDLIDSPSGCQHVYETVPAGKEGEVFTITATSHWEVRWTVDVAGNLEEGVQTTTTPASQATVRVVEVQGLRTR